MDASQAHHSVKMGSERNFGLVVGGILLLIGLWPVFFDGGVRMIFAIPAALLIIAAVAYPPVLKPLNKAWFWLGMALGAIVAPIVMGLLFFVVITPIGFLMKAIGSDLLDTRKRDTKSHWIKRDEPLGCMKNQF